MSQKIPIYIPTYISDQNYNPSRVLPRLLYYNGLIDCETYYIESGSLTESGVVKTQNAFPYFDNYNVVSGSFPTAGSDSLLFNNEAAVYGELPTASLFTQYWDTYISLLYNPKTRLLTCKAIIPLADYIKMELNDIVNFRGSYYHLRAINNYSLKTGDCELQLLGPIIQDSFFQKPPPPPPPPISSSVYWLNITDNDASSSFKIYDNGGLEVNSTTTQAGTLPVLSSRFVNAELNIAPFPTEGTPTMSLFVNGGASIAVSSSLNTTLTASFFTTAGIDYYITASVDYSIPIKTPLSWSFTEGSETTASFTIFESSSTIASVTSSASGNTLLTESKVVKIELGPETGTYKLGTTMSLFVNGGETIAISSSANEIISASFTSSAGQTYYVTGSSTYNRPPNPIVSWSFTEGTNTTASFSIADGATNIVTLTANGSGSSFVTASNTIKAELMPVSGTYVIGTTMSLFVNGATTLAVSSSANETISASFTGSFGDVFYITGSTNYNLTYVSGAKVIFDFGNTASYPGSGSTVTNLGSAGTGSDGILYGSPTFKTDNGGVIEFLSSSQQYLSFSSSVSASFTTMALIKHIGGSGSWGSSNNAYNGFPNIRGNDGIIITNEINQGTKVIAIIWAGSSTFVPSTATVSPDNINNWHSYAFSSNGSNEHKMYLDTGSAATSTNTYTRGNSGAIKSYIGYDLPNGGFLNGQVMAYLQYDRVLTADEIKDNYYVFSRRF